MKNDDSNGTEIRAGRTGLIPISFENNKYTIRLHTLDTFMLPDNQEYHRSRLRPYLGSDVDPGTGLVILIT